MPAGHVAASAPAGVALSRPGPPPPTHRRPRAPVSSFARDVREAVAALDTVEPGDRLVVFVGKLIASKGVELLLAAFPLVLAREPRARLVVVGFGAFREGLERLAAQLAAGDLAAAAQTRAEDGRELPQLAAFFERLADPRRLPRRGRRAWASGSRSRGGSTTPSSPTCCPPRRRWPSPARSPRRSAWSPPRPPPAGRCRSSRTTPGSARSPARSREAVPEAAHPWLSFEVGPDAVPAARRGAVRLARGTGGPARAHPRGDGRDHPRPLLLGRRRPHGHRRRPGRPHGPPEPLRCHAAVASATAAIVTANAVTAVERAKWSVSRPVETTAVATPR